MINTQTKFCLYIFYVLFIGLVCDIACVSFADEYIVHTLDKTFTNVSEIQFVNSEELQLTTTDGDKIVNINRLIALSKQDVSFRRSQNVVLLEDGSQIYGTIAAIKNNAVFISTEVFGLVEMPLKSIAALIFETEDYGLESTVSDWAKSNRQSDDIIYLIDGAIVLGVWTNASEVGSLLRDNLLSAVEIRRGENLNKYILSTIKAIRLSPLIHPIDLRFQDSCLKLSDGSQLSIDRIEQHGSMLKCKLASSIMLDVHDPKKLSAALASWERSPPANLYKAISPKVVLLYKPVTPWSDTPSIQWSRSVLANQILDTENTSNHSPFLSDFLVVDQCLVLLDASGDWSRLQGSISIKQNLSSMPVLSGNVGNWDHSIYSDRNGTSEEAKLLLEVYALRDGKTEPITSQELVVEELSELALDIAVENCERLVIKLGRSGDISPTRIVCFSGLRFTK